MPSRAAPASARELAPRFRGHRCMKAAPRAVRLDDPRPAALLSTMWIDVPKRLAASCWSGCRPRGGPRWRSVGAALPCRAQRRPPRPLAPLRRGYVSLHMQKCACVVQVQCHANLFWSVHRGRARACARARVWLCAAQVLPDGPGATGRGPPCADLWDGGPALARTDPPAIDALFTESLVYRP